MPLHQQFPGNTTGRDFIVGDMHGCLDLFQAQLDRIGFDPVKDRMFSVGDLADRGPDSMGCLRLLREPWFHAVRGNHEEMLIDYAYPKAEPYAYGSSSSLLLRNGGHWVLDLGKSDQDELLSDLVPRLVRLPYVITVGEGDTQFHVVHAELMTGPADDTVAWYNRLAGSERPVPKEVLTDAMLTDEVLLTMTEALVWGRRLIRQAGWEDMTEVETPNGKLAISQKPRHAGLSLSYVGHTPLKSMVLHDSHLFIDRGAFLREPETCLLVLEHARVQQWLAASLGDM